MTQHQHEQSIATRKRDSSYQFWQEGKLIISELVVHALPLARIFLFFQLDAFYYGMLLNIEATDTV